MNVKITAEKKILVLVEFLCFGFQNFTYKCSTLRGVGLSLQAADNRGRKVSKRLGRREKLF